MAVEDDHQEADLESREPSVQDLVELCRRLIRVADEIVVDLMGSASGFDYASASPEGVTHEVDGVPIPFASPRLLWRMKRGSVREKDAPDRRFLRLLLERAGDPLE